MRSDKAKRKTYIKNAAILSGEVTVYDLTRRPAEDGETVRLDKFVQPGGNKDAGYEGGQEALMQLPYGFEENIDIFGWCAAMLSESPAGSRLWQEVAAKGWSVGLRDLDNGGFHLDLPKKEIFLDHFSVSPSALGRSAYFRNSLLVDLVRALRDVWQELRNKPFEAEYGPEDVLMLERVRAADCDTVAVLVAWELRGAGYADVWRYMLGSSEGDMAMVFSRFLERDPSALFNGAALIHTFRQWYADETRVDGCDHETLEMLDDILLMSAKTNPFGRKRLKGDRIESLAVLPDGICYLKGLGETIRQDPFFAGMDDPINQAHLFHLVYDMEVTMVNNVPFRDPRLARMIFPSDPAETRRH